MAKRTNSEKMTLDRLRSSDWLADRACGNNGRVSKDLFGFVDIVAIKGEEILFIQSTAGGNGPARVKKIEEFPDELRAIKGAGIRIQVWDWRRSKRDRMWMIWKREL